MKDQLDVRRPVHRRPSGPAYAGADPSLFYILALLCYFVNTKLSRENLVVTGLTVQVFEIYALLLVRKLDAAVIP